MGLSTRSLIHNRYDFISCSFETKANLATTVVQVGKIESIDSKELDGKWLSSSGNSKRILIIFSIEIHIKSRGKTGWILIC